MGLNVEQWEHINEIVKIIHTAPLGRIEGTFVEAVRDLVYFSHSMYHHSARVGDELKCFRYDSPDIAPDQLERYRTQFESLDYINWFADEVTPRVYRDTDVISSAMRENSVLMKDWMEPNGIFYSAGMTIAAQYPYGNIYLFRSHEEGDFSENDMKTLGILNEHLCIRFANELPNGISPYYFESPLTLPVAAQFGLTEREAVILLSIRDGCLRKDLPERLFITENTLKKHLANIYRKTHVDGYEGLIQLIRSQGQINRI